MTDNTDITVREDTDITEPTALVKTVAPVEASASYTESDEDIGAENWMRAFCIIAIIHSRSFTNSGQAKKFIDALESAGHMVPARKFAEVWAEHRGDWMQSFMG